MYDLKTVYVFKDWKSKSDRTESSLGTDLS